MKEAKKGMEKGRKERWKFIKEEYQESLPRKDIKEGRSEGMKEEVKEA